MTNKVEEQKENKKKYVWHSWSPTRGKYLLGTAVALFAYGIYMQQPSPELENDMYGTAAFIKCSGSLNVNQVDEKSCRDYYEDYLNKRIDKTDNLPKIIPIDIIGSTYQTAQKQLVAAGFEPLKDLQEMSNDKISFLPSGKTIDTAAKDDSVLF